MVSEKKWYILVVLTFLLWGTQHPPVKILSHEVPSVLLNFLRFAVALVAILPFVCHKKIVPPLKDLGVISLLGVIGIAIYGFLVVEGIRLSTATNSAILINSHPLLTAIFAPILIKEQSSLKKLFGVIVGFFGAYLVIANGLGIGELTKSEYLIGNFLLFISAVCVGIYALYSKQYILQYGGLHTTFYAVLSGTIVLLIWAIFKGEILFMQYITPFQWGLIVYVGILNTALAWVVWFNAVGKIGIVSTAPFFFLIPVSGIISSNMVLNESLTIFAGIGTFLILMGVYIVQKN